MTTTTADASEVPDAPDAAEPSVAAPNRFSPAKLFTSYGPSARHRRPGPGAAGVGARARSTAFRLGNLGKYCCWAIAAVGIGLAWGRGGMLVMGQGVFFGLGGYAMAMHMKLEAAGPGNVPDFMVLYGDATMPGWWEPFRSGPFTLFAIIALPAVVSFILGYAILKRRVKGAYFAILTQAMAVAFSTLLIATIKQTGGFNGLNTFTTFFGQNLYDPTVKKNLYLIAAGLLIVCLVIVWQLYRSRYGELLVATRDAEERVRFLGYDPANIKLVAFVVAAIMASVGGAMFAPDRRHHLALQRGRDGIDHDDRRCRPRWTGLVARPGAGCHRRRLRAVHAVGAVPDQLDLLPGCAVHRGHAVPPGGIASLGSKLKGLWPRRSSGVGPDRGRGGGGGMTIVVPRRGLPGDPRPDRRLRRLQGDRRRRRHLPPGAAALPHRPERRGQDHLGRRPDRAGARHRPGGVPQPEPAHDEVAQDRAPGHRPDLPDRDGVRAAQRPAEPGHRGRAAPQGDGAAARPPEGARERRAGVGDHRPDRAGGSPGRDPGARPEAVARGRHAARAGRQGDVPRRDGRGHEQPRSARRPASCCSGSSATGPSSSSSTTWSSCAPTPTS